MRAVFAQFAAWSRTRAPGRRAYLVVGLLGFSAYLLVYGWGHFVGTSSDWELPSTDERAYLMGYRYFLYEPWHWPVFLSHTIDVPFAKSIAFSDAIPVWALLNKAIAALLPPWESFSEHAYLGMWHATVYILQACFGVALLRALGHTSWRAALLTAVMFLAVHAWIFRYGHAALSAHWLELWALTLYLRTPARSPSPGLRASRRGGSARGTRPRSRERSLPGLQAADAQLRTAVPRRRRATSRSDSTGGATSSSRTFSQT